MYELVRPICRDSLNDQTVNERRRTKMNLMSQDILLKLKQGKQIANQALQNNLANKDNETQNGPPPRML